MKRLLILCEGQTEETFINQLLVPHLALRDIAAACTMISTSQVQGRRAHRGGHGHRYALIRKDIIHLLRSRPDAVSTMIDLYAFPEDMPGYPAAWPGETRKRHELLTSAFTTDIGDRRFIPGIVAHEFEGLLFSEPATIADVVATDAHTQATATEALVAAARTHATPEDIDNSPQTAPSKRLEAVLPGYRKPLHGPRIAARIGLDKLRATCPLFSEWLSRLESLHP